MPDQQKAAYGLVQLRDLPDAAEAGGFSDTMAARFARVALGAERVGVSLQRFKPGSRQPFAHRHDDDEEVYVVVAGSGRAVLDGEVVELRRWSALRVSAGTTRAFEGGDEGLELLAFGSHTDGDRGETSQPAWPDAS